MANEGRLATADGLGSFAVIYGAGSAYGVNNLVLISAIPEPSTLVMLLGGAGALGLFRLRSRMGGVVGCAFPE